MFATVALSVGLMLGGQLTTPAKPPAADLKDVASIDAIVHALYDVISGPAGKQRDWDRMRSLFVQSARMGAVVRGASPGKTRYIGFDVDRYIAMDDKLMTERGFFERELHRHVDRFGNIAQVFSTYESRWKLGDPKPFERGINSLELAYDGDRWWVVSILWQGEEKDAPLPRQWLPR